MNRFFKIILLSVGFLSLVMGSFFWWMQIRPYIKIENARIVTPQQRLRAKKSGLISCLASYPGKKIAKGEELATFFHEEVQEELAKIQNEIESQKQNLVSVKRDLDEGMKKYIEANAQGGEFLEPALMVIQQAQLATESIDARIQTLEIDKKTLHSRTESKILAPDDCVILQQLKREGDSIAEGEEFLVVSKPSSFFVEAQIPVHMLKEIQANLPAVVSFPSFSSKKWNGQVASVGPEVVDGMVRIQIESANLPLHPGLTGEIQIRVK